MPEFFRLRFPGVIAAASAVAILLGPILPISNAAAADDPKDSVPVQETPASDGGDRFIVKFRDPTRASSEDRNEAYAAAGDTVDADIKELHRTGDGARVIQVDRELTSDDAGDLVQALSGREDVEYAEQDVLLHPTLVPDDPHFTDLWSYQNTTAGIALPETWERSTGKDTVVAVIDTGITNHSDLNENLVPGYDMISSYGLSRDGDGRDPNPQDEGDWCPSDSSSSSWHGTHVAGTIGAIAGNGKGIAGVAYDTKIMPIRALGTCGGYLSDAADGVRWAAGGSVYGVPSNPIKADVVNMSLGGESFCGYSMQSAINFAVEQGTTVVVSAGNDRSPAAYYSPAGCENVITVAASGPTGNPSYYTNYGSAVDVTAPGGDANYARGSILSTVNTGSTVPEAEGYGSMQGTSMAAPHVAGIAALLKSAKPTLTPAEIETALKQTARPITGYYGEYGAGLVSALASLGSLVPSITSGTVTVSGAPVVDSTLSVDPGTWTTGTALSYQWFRDDAAISGATATRYTLSAEDVGSSVAVRVSGTKAGYLGASVLSDAQIIQPGTFDVPTPVILGTAKVGQRLTVDSGVWPRGTTLVHTWYRDGSPLLEHDEYRLREDDLGSVFSVYISGEKPGYTPVMLESAPTAPVLAGDLTGPVPTISGTAKTGETLTVNPGAWTEGATLKYKWLRDGKTIAGATATNYRLTPTDAGKRILVRVIGTKPGYTTAWKDSAATAAVAKAALRASTPKIAGVTKVGKTLTAWKGTWTSGAKVEHQWLRNGKSIKGATKSKYKLTASDASTRIQVRTTGTLLGYTESVRTSAKTMKVSKGTLATAKPKISGTAKIGKPLTAKRGTWTVGTKFSYQWYANGKAVKKATQSSFKPTSSQRGKKLTVKVTGSRAGYTTVSKTSNPTSSVRR
ncbi:MAG: S8 family serine peptidase [Actinomycetota bacterium]